MASNNKVTLPSSGGGLMRYFDDYKSKVSLQPGHVIILVVIVIVIALLLRLWGNSMLGLG